MKRRVIGLPEVSLGIKPKKGSKYAKGGWLPKYQDGGKLKDEVYGRKRNPDIVLEDRFNLPRTEKGKQYNIPSSVETAYHTAYKNYLAQSGGDKQKLADIYNKLELQEMTPDIMVKKFGTKYETPPSRDSFLLAKTKGGIPYAKRLALETLLFGPDRPTAKEFASKKFGKGMQGPTLDNGGFLNNISQGILSGLGNAILPGIGGVLLPQGNELARMEDGGKIPYGGVEYPIKDRAVTLGKNLAFESAISKQTDKETPKKQSVKSTSNKQQASKTVAEKRSRSIAEEERDAWNRIRQNKQLPYPLTLKGWFDDYDTSHGKLINLFFKNRKGADLHNTIRESFDWYDKVGSSTSEVANIKSEFPNFDPNEWRRKQQSINPTMSPIEQALFSFLGAKGAVTGTSAAIKVLQRLGKLNKNKYSSMLDDYLNTPTATSKVVEKATPRRKGKYDELFDFKYGGKLPKVIQSISPIADLFVPGLGSAMGILGAGISAVEAKKDRRMEQNSKFSALGANTNPYGYAHGGMLKGRHDLSYYKGRSHATGGIMVNSNGVPSDNVSAEVEGKEARFSVGGKTYIFSERLKI